MLNEPASYGKTHLLKSRVCPALRKLYKAKGVMMASPTGTTALALGTRANTIHGLAGVGRGHGSAEKIHQGMPETAHKCWRDVQVMSCLACHLMSCMPRNSRVVGQPWKIMCGVEVTRTGLLCGWVHNRQHCCGNHLGVAPEQLLPRMHTSCPLEYCALVTRSAVICIQCCSCVHECPSACFSCHSWCPR